MKRLNSHVMQMGQSAAEPDPPHCRTVLAWSTRGDGAALRAPGRDRAVPLFQREHCRGCEGARGHAVCTLATGWEPWPAATQHFGVDVHRHTSIDYYKFLVSQHYPKWRRLVGRLPLSTEPRAHDEQPQGRRSTPWKSAATTGNPKRAKGAQHGEYAQGGAASRSAWQVCRCFRTHPRLELVFRSVRSDTLSSRRGSLGRRRHWLGHRADRGSGRLCGRQPCHSRDPAASPADRESANHTAQRAASAGRYVASKSRSSLVPNCLVASCARLHVACRTSGLCGCCD
jgi:hypothetical protein